VQSRRVHAQVGGRERVPPPVPTHPSMVSTPGDPSTNRRSRGFNEASIIRLIGAVLLEQNDEWLLQCRYMQIEGMAELTQPLIDADPAKLPPLAA
jgi:hypothetical protein